MDIKPFNDFIASLYDDAVVPPVIVVSDDGYSAKEYYERTGCIPVLMEDETVDCPVFGNWGSYYAFEGWRAYRALSNRGNEFQSMVADVVHNMEWSPETSEWISVISALVDVQYEYEYKFGHCPVDLKKFIKSYIRYGVSTVLRADVY